MYDKYEYDKYDLMYNSIMKNIQELSELCVDSGILNSYDLMNYVENYKKILNFLKDNNGKDILRDLGYRIVRKDVK